MTPSKVRSWQFTAVSVPTPEPKLLPCRELRNEPSPALETKLLLIVAELSALIVALPESTPSSVTVAKS